MLDVLEERSGPLFDDHWRRKKFGERWEPTAGEKAAASPGSAAQKNTQLSNQSSAKITFSISGSASAFAKWIKETHSHGRVDRETSYEGDPLTDSQKLYFQADSRSTGIEGALSNVTWPSVLHRWAPSPPNDRQVTRSPVPLSWLQILWFLAFRPVMASNTAIERSLRI